MNAETQALLTALQAYFDINGEWGIDILVNAIDGYGRPEDTISEWDDSTGDVGDRPHMSVLAELDGTNIQLMGIICVDGQPKADDPDAEAQRQANIRYWNKRRVVGSFAGMDNDQDGVSDRLKAPRQGVNFPGNQWPDFIQARKWADPSVSPSLEGSELVEGVMVYRDPEAAQESLRRVVAAAENGWVTPG